MAIGCGGNIVSSSETLKVFLQPWTMDHPESSTDSMYLRTHLATIRAGQLWGGFYCLEVCHFGQKFVISSPSLASVGTP